jgi:hypothetical protein
MDASSSSSSLLRSVIDAIQKTQCDIVGEFVRNQAYRYLADVPIEVALHNMTVLGCWPYNQLATHDPIVIDVALSSEDDARLVAKLRSKDDIKILHETHHAPTNVICNVRTLHCARCNESKSENVLVNVNLHVPKEKSAVKPAMLLPIAFDSDCLVIRPTGRIDLKVVPRSSDLNASSILRRLKRRIVVTLKHDVLKCREMFRNDWYVQDIKGIAVDPNDEEEESCILCLGTCQSKHLKRTCCNARYHVACFKTMQVTMDRCPMCRDPL